jgi:ABC-type proline/glycine betaine transport system permease subunit
MRRTAIAVIPMALFGLLVWRLGLKEACALVWMLCLGGGLFAILLVICQGISDMRKGIKEENNFNKRA